jgi:hypothetical protein
MRLSAIAGGRARHGAQAPIEKFRETIALRLHAG